MVLAARAKTHSRTVPRLGRWLRRIDGLRFRSDAYSAFPHEEASTCARPIFGRCN